jgi:hypothetical protein
MARSTDAVRIRSLYCLRWTLWALIVKLEPMLVVAHHSLSALGDSSWLSVL